MYIENVRLPYTLWYDGKDKIFRMDMSTILPEEHYEDGKKYVGKIRNVHVGGYNVEGDVRVPVGEDGQNYRDVSEFATAVYNEEKHYVDITLKAFPSFNADGEIILYIDYEFAKGIEEYLTDYSFKNKTAGIIIPIRSHENPSKDPGRFTNGIGIDKLDVRNGFAHTVGANEEPIVFSFELIERDITDEFITNGQALDMVKNKAVENAVLRANDTGLGISLNYKSYDQLSWDTLKQYLGGSNPTEYVATTIEDIMSLFNNASDNSLNAITNSIVTDLQSHMSVSGVSGDITVYYRADFYASNGQHINELRPLFTISKSMLGHDVIKQEVLDDLNTRIPDKETLKNEILAAVPTPSSGESIDKETLKSEIINSVLRMNFIQKGMNNMSISAHDINELLNNGPDEANEVTNTILGNFQEWQKHIIFIKHNDYYEVAYQDTGLAPRMLLKIPFSELREVTGGSITLDSILEALKDDTKENVLTQIKEKLSIVNTDTLKHELLNALPAKDDYNLSYDGISLYLTKTNDSSYMKSVQITPEINIDRIDAGAMTSKLKPELDKSYYSKEEVDRLIQQLKNELMSEDHGEEHPQQ